MRTAWTLEAEREQLQGSGVWGQRKISQVQVAFGLLDFTMLRPVLAWRSFWNVWTDYFFNFQFSSGRGGFWISEYGGTTLLPGRISILHTATFATVWRTTGRLWTKNRLWRRLKSPSNEKPLECRFGEREPGSSVPNHCIRVKGCNPEMSQVGQIVVVGSCNSNGYENILFVIRTYARWHNQVP
jgi:hypothetical protein